MDYIKQLLGSCPYIEADPLDMHVDNPEIGASNYSIGSTPANPILQQYKGGDAKKQHMFIFIARKTTLSDEDRAKNIELHDNISRWMNQESRLRRLPAIDEYRQPLKLYATDGGYLYEREDNNDSGLYAMTCCLEYYEKARN